MSLTFLTPLMLAGAALVAAPIILHLVMRQQPKHLVFPALRFIKRREDANRRQLRLRHLLLLLLRCGAIVFLALAMARPSLQSAGLLGDQEAPVAAALIFDTSPRMQYRHQNQTRLQAAQEAAGRVLAQLPPGSEVAVVDSRSLEAAFAVDLAVARQRVERLNITGAGQPLAELCEDALRLVGESQQARKEVYVFSDLGRAAWPTAGSTRLRDRLAASPDVAFYVVDVGVENPQDVALGDLRLSSDSLARHTPLRVETDVAGHGAERESTVALYLVDSSGKSSLRAQANAKTSPEQPQAIDFEVAGLEVGTHQGIVRIGGEDSLPADDARYFTVEVRPAWKVLIAAPKPMERRAIFLSEALAPAAFRRTGQARFECEVTDFADLTNKTLRDYAAVCLLDPPPLSDAAWNELRSYVDQGGGLAVWLGRNAQPQGKPVEDFNAPTAMSVLPGKLVQQWHRQDAFLAPANYEHPLLARFRSIAGSVPWDAFTVWSHWQLANLAEGANTVVDYSNGQAAIVERSLGKGRVLVFTTPISDEATDPDLWNLLAVGSEPWPFVILANESLMYLVGSGNERRNYLAGETVTLRVPEDQRQLIYSLRTPDGQEQPQAVDQKTGLATITTSQAVGNYLLRAGGAEQGVRRGFSVNIPAAATDLRRMTNEELVEMLGKDRFRLSRGRDEIERDVSLGRTGRELFGLLIVLVAVLLGLEHLLANKFYRRDPAGMKPKVRTLAAVETAEKKEPATV